MTTASVEILEPATDRSVRGILDRVVARGVTDGQRVAETVLASQPEDFLIAGRALAFRPDADGLRVELADGGHAWSVHRHALNQLAERVGVPIKYVDRLGDGAAAPWQRELLGEILHRSYQHTGGRYLVRTCKHEVRGFLSDKYRRLDSRPLLQAFVTAASTAGAVPYGGTVTDLRFALRVIQPQPIEVFSGEHVVLGLEIGNSDYGAARYTVSEFILRVLCLNGAVGQDFIGKVHLGARLGDSIEFSRRTYELDTATALSATRDVVRSALGVEHRRDLLGRITAAAQNRGSFDRFAASLKTLSKDETRKVKEAFEGPDVVNLPPEPTAWRLGQAISWVAQGSDTGGDRRLELERLSATVAGIAAPAA